MRVLPLSRGAGVDVTRRVALRLSWWVYSGGVPIYAVDTRAEARTLADAWRADLPSARVTLSTARHRSADDAIAAHARGEVAP